MIFYKEKFKARRLQLRYTITELANQCAVTRATVSRWENGNNIPSKANVELLANILNVSVSEISDLADREQRAVLTGISEFNELSDITRKELREQETAFIEGIKKQRRQVEKANLVISSLLNSMHSMFYIKDCSNRYVMANNEYLKLIDLPKGSDIDGKDDEFYFPKNEGLQNTKLDQQVLELKERIVNRQMYIPGTRKKKWGLVTKVPIINQEDKVEGMLCTIKDITEEKNANELNLELKSAISNIQDVVWTGTVTDYRFKYTSVNDATKKLLGLTEEQFSKDEWKQHVHPDFMGKVEKYLKDNKTNPKQIEYQYIHPVNGKTRWLQNRINVDGEHYFGIIRDVTDIYQEKTEKEYLFECLSNVDSMFWVAERLNSKKTNSNTIQFPRG